MCALHGAAYLFVQAKHAINAKHLWQPQPTDISRPGTAIEAHKCTEWHRSDKVYKEAAADVPHADGLEVINQQAFLIVESSGDVHKHVQNQQELQNLIPNIIVKPCSV